MSTHNFQMVNLDTDAISFCYPDFSTIDKELQSILLDEINSLLPPMIQMDHDGYYECVVVVRTKNYILYDGKKITVKGSGLKGSTRPTAIKEFISKIVEIMVMVKDTATMYENLQELYNGYLNEVLHITDIKRWSARKTLSSTMQESERANETKAMKALEGSNYTEGDRMHMFYLPDDSLCLAENFKGEYNKTRLLKNLFDTISIFDTVLPVKELFPNYSLKRNQKLLENV